MRRACDVVTRRASAALYAAFVLGWTATAAAQEDAEVHDVVVRGVSEKNRERERAHESSRAMSVTDAEDVRERAPHSLADALRSTPSVSVQQTTPGQGTVYVRGLSGRALVHTVDGVRLNTAFFRAGNNEYLGLVDPYALELIRVEPGAASVEHGGDSLGGAVLMSTATPGYRLDAPRTSYRFFQSLSSNPVGTASRVSVLRETATWGAHAGFTYYQAGAVRPGAGELSPDPSSYADLERDTGDAYAPVLVSTQRGTEFETYATDFAARSRLGDRWDLTLRVQYSVRPELFRYDQITPRFKRELPQRAERSLKPMSRTMASALLKRTFSGWFEQVALQLAWQRIFERRRDRGIDEVCIDVPEPAVPEECERFRLEPASALVFEDNASDAVSARAELRGANADRTLRVTLGTDARYEVVSSSAETLDLDTLVTATDPPRYPDQSVVNEAGLYAHAAYRFLPALSAYAGLRGSVFPLDIPARGGDLPSPPVEQVLVDFSASLGARWEFVPGVAWVVNGGRGVRGPNIEDFAGLGSRARGRFQVPNPDIGSEHSYTVDTGVKLWRSADFLQTVVFYSRYDDAIVLAPTSVDGEDFHADGERFYHSVNAASVELFGIEAALEVALSSELAVLARAVSMIGIEHNPPESGLPAETPADRVPPAQGELGLRYRPRPDLELEVSAAGRAEQDRLNDPVNLDDNRIPEGGTPGYVTFHARGSYRADEQLMLRLAFDNVTDRLVLEHGSGFYQPGFAVTGSIELVLE